MCPCGNLIPTDKGNARYCSFNCYNRKRLGQRRGTYEKHKPYKKGKILSAEHKTKIGLANNGERNAFFGRSHSYQARLLQSLAKRGFRHPNWKGGITELRREIRNLFHYNVWRQTVFRRDDYTCVACHSRAPKLNADHYPLSFAEILYSNNIKSIQDAVACDELWNTDNGRTLCIPCHKSTINFAKRYEP